jgi:hypothetical protein
MAKNIIGESGGIESGESMAASAAIMKASSLAKRGGGMAA